jgi:hypothetical protein
MGAAGPPPPSFVQAATSASLRELIKELRRRGASAISLDELEKQLVTEQARQLVPPDYSGGTTAATQNTVAKSEKFKAGIEAGQTALRTAITINGGAAVALLAFLGNLAAKQVPAHKLLPWSMLAFFGGVLFGAFSLGARYFTQLTDYQDHVTAPRIFNNVAIALGIVSLLAFSVGGVIAFLALR